MPSPPARKFQFAKCNSKFAGVTVAAPTAPQRALQRGQSRCISIGTVFSNGASLSSSGVKGLTDRPFVGLSNIALASSKLPVRSVIETAYLRLAKQGHQPMIRGGEYYNMNILILIKKTIRHVFAHGPKHTMNKVMYRVSEEWYERRLMIHNSLYQAG
jgi:hypothetical protein